MLYNPSRARPFASGPDVSARPFRSSTGDLCWSGGNKARRLVGACDHVNGFSTHTNGVGYADKDPPYDTNTPEGKKGINNELHIQSRELPDKELAKSSCPLMDCDVQRIELKLEEDSWSAPTVGDLPSVMGDTVLIRTQWLAPRCDVCRRNNVKKVLVGDES